MSYIEVKHSSKIYNNNNTKFYANNNVSFNLNKGELTVIVGASGAGKSTLLNILGGMDSNSEGQVIVNGRDISNYNDK